MRIKTKRCRSHETLGLPQLHKVSNACRTIRKSIMSLGENCTRSFGERATSRSLGKAFNFLCFSVLFSPLILPDLKHVTWMCVMSMKRLSILSANSNHGGLNYTEMSTTPGSPPPPIHGVNVMLGGAMLSGIILVVFIMCYCCHKNARKQETHLPAYWRDSGLPLHVYTVEGHQQCFESEEFVLSDIQAPPTPGPPPAYEAVVPVHKNIVSPARIRPADDSGLPSYEAALRLETNGHV